MSTDSIPCIFVCYALNQEQLEQNVVMNNWNLVGRKLQNFQAHSSIHFPCFKWKKKYILLMKEKFSTDFSCVGLAMQKVIL